MTSLRELKKARTYAAIQEHALRLFRQQGYAQTTVDQIAAAAEVSPSTFFRYFPTKEDTVLYDPLDPVMIEIFGRQPAELSPIEALRATLRDSVQQLSEEQWQQEQERHRLVFSVPELRSRMFEHFASGIDLLAGLAAERVGGKAEDFAARAWAGAVIGVVMVAHLESADAPLKEYLATLDRAFGQLAAGLPLS